MRRLVARHDGEESMEKIKCSFCGISMAEAKGRVVAGPTVFICRNCVDICVEVFSKGDVRWRDDKIKQLKGLRERNLYRSFRAIFGRFVERFKG
jgi:hypothetical protein